jgi:hypothetical protein
MGPTKIRAIGQGHAEIPTWLRMLLIERNRLSDLSRRPVETMRRASFVTLCPEVFPLLPADYTVIQIAFCLGFTTCLHIFKGALAFPLIL